MNISQVSPNYNNMTSNMSKNSKNKKDINFKGYLVCNKALTKLETSMAYGFAKFADSTPMESLVKKTNSNKKIHDNLFAHLIVFGSTLLSGMYMVKTITNKKLEDQKRKTLAINQGIVFVLSTVMAYTFDKMLAKKTNHVIDKYKALNANEKNLANQVKGIKIAKTTIIIDMVYRFIAPVAVTPVANYFGNKMQEKKAARAKVQAYIPQR